MEERDEEDLRQIEKSEEERETDCRSDLGEAEGQDGPGGGEEARYCSALNVAYAESAAYKPCSTPSA